MFLMYSPIYTCPHYLQQSVTSRMLLVLQSSGSPSLAFQVPYDSFKEQLDSNSSDRFDIDSSVDGIQVDKLQNLDYDFRCFFLSTQRLDLYRSIDFRCEDMLLGMVFFLTLKHP